MPVKKRIKQILSFGLVGTIGYLADASITVLFGSLLGVYGARVPAFAVAVTATWYLNRIFTFGRGSSRHTSLVREYGHYVSVMLVGLIVNYVVFAISVTLIREYSYGIFLSVGIGSLSGMVVNYFFSHRFIYTQNTDVSN